jgi:peptidoglycan hydrolase CwlO-like protein
MSISKIILSIIATLILIFSLIISLNVFSYLAYQKLYSLNDIANFFGGIYVFISLLIGIFASFLFMYWSLPKTIVNETIELTKEISNTLNKIRDEILVIQEVDKNLNYKINENSNKLNELEERIVALEKLVIEISSLIKK